MLYADVVAVTFMVDRVVVLAIVRDALALPVESV
jgi:hypothetical protein